MKSFLTYQDAGVHIEEANESAKQISTLAQTTYTPHVIGGIGGFGSLFSLKETCKHMDDPVLVSGTDGVGTKLLVAIEANQFDGIGQDLVAMCANDILVSGAKPLFFLDYFAQGKLETHVLLKIVESISHACASINCALVGGETAEMPGLYSPGHFDLAGFCVGVVDRKKIIDGKNAQSGDILIGLESSGLHSNGFSLARKVLPTAQWAHTLLKPTRLYVNTILHLLQDNFPIKAMAHITGGGLIENIPRTLPRGLQAHIDYTSWQEPEVFTEIRHTGPVSQEEMARTFNLGIGYTIVCSKENQSSLVSQLEALGEKPHVIGNIQTA